jgi:hypothetical protein
MPVKQEDLLGMLVPTADITKVTLESARPSGLSVTVNLSVYDVVEKDKISRWFAQEDFARFIKVALFQASSRTARAIVNSAMTLTTAQNIIDFTEREDIKVVTYSMNEVLPREEDYFDNSVRTVQSDGTSFHEFVFSETFKLDKEPEELNYAAFAYIDIQEMEDFFNVELMSRFQQEKSARQNGKVSYEEVIRNGETVSTSIVYLTKDGEVWNGPKHPRNGNWYRGTREAGDDLILNGAFPEILRTVEVPNSKVQDFRILERATKLEIDETLFHNLLSEVAIADQSSVETLRQTFYSDIWLTRGLPGEARLMFAVDLATMIRKLGHYGKILDRMDAESQKRLLSYTKIRAMKILRKRVVNVETLNSIGTPYGGKTDFDRNQEIEVVVFSGQIDRDLVEVSDDNGSIREAPIALESENLGVRFFTCTDKNVESITDGLYQYGVELDFVDGTRQFLQEMIDELSISRNNLSSILARVEAPVNKKDYLYNPNLNRFEDNFQLTQVERRNIFKATEIYSRTISIFGNQTILPTLVANLISQTPSFMRFVIEVFDLLISKLSASIEISTDHLSDSKIGSGLKFIITDRKFFTNSTFDSNIDKGNGLDFLTNPDESGEVDNEILEISEEQRATIGLKTVDAGEWEKRINLELEKFFTSKEPESTFPEKNSKSLEPTPPTDLSGEGSAYMTPIIIKNNRLIIPNVLDSDDEQKKKEDRALGFDDIFSGFGISFENPADSILRSDDKIDRIEDISSCFGIDENREVAIDPIEGWKEVNGQIVSIGREEGIDEEYITSTGACEEDKRGASVFDLMRETIVNVGIQKSTPEGLLSEGDLRRVYSSIDNLAPPMRKNLKFAPIQIQSLFPEFEDESLSKGSDLTGPKFRLNYSFLAKVEYLKDFGDNEVVFENEKERKNYKQIKEPVWESLDKRYLLTVAGQEILCRLKLFTIEELGIKVSDPFKQLPIYDAYFILKSPVTRINVDFFPEPEEGPEVTAPEEEETVGTISFGYQEILRAERIALVSELNDIQTEIRRIVSLINELEDVPEANRNQNQPQIAQLNEALAPLNARARDIERELEDPRFDIIENQM